MKPRARRVTITAAVLGLEVLAREGVQFDPLLPAEEELDLLLRGPTRPKTRARVPSSVVHALGFQVVLLNILEPQAEVDDLDRMPEPVTAGVLLEGSQDGESCLVEVVEDEDSYWLNWAREPGPRFRFLQANPTPTCGR
jgi:hypothetical protein